MTSRPHEPATIEQLVAAIMALGLWEGENTPEELEREARRLGGAEAYRMSVCNVLLGMVQAQAVLADGTGGVTPEQREAAWNEQLRAVGADDEHAEMFMGFLRWQALRLGMPLREIASREETGAVPLAAAHAVEGLQGLLEVIGAGQGIITGRGVASADVDELVRDGPLARGAQDVRRVACTYRAATLADHRPCRLSPGSFANRRTRVLCSATRGFTSENGARAAPTTRGAAAAYSSSIAGQSG